MKHAVVLMRCDGCQAPLVIRATDDGTTHSCAFITMLGRHWCGECSEMVLGINLYPGFLLLANGLSDQKAYGWN